MQSQQQDCRERKSERGSDASSVDYQIATAFSLGLHFGKLGSVPEIGGISGRMQDVILSASTNKTERTDGLLSGIRSRLRRGISESDESVDENTPAYGELVREGERIRLRRHVPANRAAFQRWYADPEIAYLLRHDLTPLSERQSRGYFDTIILPMSLQGYCFAIHTVESDTFIGSTALTDAGPDAPQSALFRIVIGEKWAWDQGFGTEATRLVVAEAFETLGLDEVQLEVFRHNPRAISAYRKVGFHRTGAHTEFVPPEGTPLHVVEMSIHKSTDSSDEQPEPES